MPEFGNWDSYLPRRSRFLHWKVNLGKAGGEICLYVQSDEHSELDAVGVQ